MALKTMIENLNKARKNYEDQLKELGKDSQAAVSEFLAPHIPPGFVLQWAQYTPYFNDGEACIFRVGEPFLIKIPETGIGDLHRYSEENDDCVSKYETKGRFDDAMIVEGLTVGQARAAFKAWDELPEDLLEAAFGDHVKVNVTSTSYDVDEYEHD